MIELLKQKIAKIKDTATERSYYPLLCAFFEEYAKSNALKLRNPQATPEETSTQYEHRIGFPDITIRNGNDLIGWVEVKIPQENLNAEKLQEQFSRYKESLENIIFTNLREWQLWQWEEGEAKKTADTSFDLTDINNASSDEFESFLIKFFEGRVYQTRTPKQLALALAKKTRLLSQQVEEALGKSEADSDLQKLKETFEKTLIQDITEHQFANMVAETMAYSLFLAALEHSRRGNGTELTLTNAIDYLPTNVPILADLYSLIKKVASTIPTIYEAARLLVDQLNASEIERIHQKLVEHKPGEDPVIQFYEPFLKEYDPKEREARGVYYTPKPVVDYIVKSVDWLLRKKFNKEKGLADESVYLLDPATGTGTFLMSAIQEIYRGIQKQNSSLGEEMVKREFNRVVLSHILKHFYGFELLIAPYAIAHLKLTLEVERLGFDFANTKDDSDKDNDRFKVYLANTLDDPNKPPAKLFGFDSIPQESENARKIKNDAPILAIIGNPPYSGISMNMLPQMRGLVEKYKYIDGQKIVERGALQLEKNLNDDYVKFISFAQGIVEKRGFGVVAYITNNGYLDNPTLRGLRKNLLDSFDELYFLNLFGSTKRGDADQSVFNIQTGTAIMFLVKKLSSDGKKVFYSEIKGSRLEKYDFLNRNLIATTEWKEITPRKDMFFLLVKDDVREEEYSNLFSSKNVFPEYGAGIITARDAFIIAFDKQQLRQNVKKFEENISLPNNKLCEALDIPQKKGWNIDNSKKSYKEDVNNIDEFIEPISYRPFDDRHIFYHKSLIWGMSKPTMRNFQERDNLGLILCRQVNNDFGHIFITNKLVESSFISNKTKEINSVFPLYFYPEKDEGLFVGEVSNIAAARQPNISLTFAREMADKIGRVYYPVAEYPTKEGDTRLTPEEIFYYVYAILHSPTYRSRYTEQLKIDFPRLPLTSDKKLFAQLVRFGNELVNQHLLGENPFDKSKTIFDEQEKWGIKIGGAKPANLPDWQVADVSYNEKDKRVYVNKGQYFEGVGKEVWEFMIGGYQVCEKWLKDRKKAERALSTDDLKHYMKMVVAIRETIRIMGEIDKAIPSWPIK